MQTPSLFPFRDEWAWPGAAELKWAEHPRCAQGKLSYHKGEFTSGCETSVSALVRRCSPYPPQDSSAAN